MKRNKIPVFLLVFAVGFSLISCENTTTIREFGIREMDTEVLVIGAGAAGLSAAIIAKHHGVDVTFIEKNANAQLSATHTAGGAGAAWAADHTPVMEFDRLNVGGRYMGVRYANDHRLLWLYVRNFMRANAFRQTFGFHMVGGQLPGAQTGRLGQEAFEREGGQILFDHKAIRLNKENGRVVGALVETPTGLLRINAERGVILATGGYFSNPGLMPSGHGAESLNSGPLFAGHGDGILMAIEPSIGAMTRFMHRVKIYSQGVEVAPGLGAIAIARTFMVHEGAAAIYVNSEGERWVNETRAAMDLVYIKNRQLVAPVGLDAPDPDQRLYFLMDNRTFFNSFRVCPFGDHFWPVADLDAAVTRNDALPGLPLVLHGTLENIESRRGMPPGSLQASVTAWNTSIDTQAVDCGFGQDMSEWSSERRELARFDPTVIIPQGTANPNGVASEFFLVEMRLHTSVTLGGLVITDRMEVLDRGSQPIPGLYAAGEIVGGVHGYENLQGQAMGWALVSGYLAGLSVANRVDWIVNPNLEHVYGSRSECNIEFCCRP